MFEDVCRYSWHWISSAHDLKCTVRHGQERIYVQDLEQIEIVWVRACNPSRSRAYCLHIISLYSLDGQCCPFSLFVNIVIFDMTCMAAWVGGELGQTMTSGSWFMLIFKLIVSVFLDGAVVVVVVVVGFVVCFLVSPVRLACPGHAVRKEVASKTPYQDRDGAILPFFLFFLLLVRIFACSEHCAFSGK